MHHVCRPQQAVTSWGFTDGSYKVQGASMFGNNDKYPVGTNYGTRGTGNIAKLIYDGESDWLGAPTRVAIDST
jgi:hypothetical protein